MLVELSLLKVLSAIPVHSMITNGLSNSHLEKLNAKIRRFIWSKDNLKKGMHHIKWDTLIRPRNHGGIHIKDLTILRSAIKCKRILEYLNSSDKLWVKVYKVK